jgi:hypothetical protein
MSDLDDESIATEENVEDEEIDDGYQPQSSNRNSNSNSNSNDNAITDSNNVVQANKSEDLTIDVAKNIPFREEMEIIIEASTNSSSQSPWKLVNQLLLNFLYCYVTDKICGEARSNTETICKNLSDAAIDTVKNLPKTQKFAEGIMKYFPQNKWPPGFEDFVNEESDKQPPPSWLARIGLIKSTKESQLLTNKSMSTAKYQYWGSRIFDIGRESKGIINSYLNKKWVPSWKLKSGRNVTGLHMAIRAFYVDSYLCPHSANEYVAREKRRNKQNIKTAESQKVAPPRGEITDEEAVAMYDEKYRTEKEKYKSDYFPKEYLTWLLIGKPNIIGLGIAATLNNGSDNRRCNQPLDRTASGASALYGGTQYEAEQTVGAGKETRKRFHEYTNSSKAGSQNDGSNRSSNTKSIQHTVAINRPEEDHATKKMKLLEKEIELLKRLNMDTTEAEMKLLQTVRGALQILDQEDTAHTSTANHQYAIAATPITRLVQSNTNNNVL